jgi:hypothetical protein
MRFALCESHTFFSLCVNTIIWFARGFLNAKSRYFISQFGIISSKRLKSGHILVYNKGRKRWEMRPDGPNTGFQPETGSGFAS